MSIFRIHLDGNIKA
ncbi:hypothetical protein ACPEHA_21165 [Escherichia coli]|nr:hypothetical protein [Escherichia coli]MCG9401039.1 hypothetical protein [Escherichia coli]